MTRNTTRFCSCLTHSNLSANDQARLVHFKTGVLKAAKWDDGANITVRFLEGDPALHARVIAAAREWTKPGLADLRFDVVTSGPADIRIAFKPGAGSWSYLGTECRLIDEAEPTMNFGWLTAESPEDELRAVVLHEFGHAIGLVHEHMLPKGGIKWNREKVIADLSRPPNNWSPERIEQNVFKVYQADDLVATDTVDPLSIMMYPIPEAWTDGDFSAGVNTTISALDAHLISNIYPQ